MAEHLDERGRPRVGHRQRAIGFIGDRPRCDRVAIERDAIPTYAIHQVQEAPAFERFGNRRVVHARDVKP